MEVKDINLLGIFTLGNILAMREYFAEALLPLIDNYIGSYIQDFFNKVDALEYKSPEVCVLKYRKDEMYKILGEKVKKATFYKQAEDNGIINFIKSIGWFESIYSLPDIEETNKKLEWLLSNRQYWSVKISPRKAEDFDKFLIAVRKLEDELPGRLSALCNEYDIDIFDIPYNKNLVNTVKANKALFYVQREKGSSTCLEKVLENNKPQYLEMLLHGIKYQKVCQDEGLDIPYRRQFLGI